MFGRGLNAVHPGGVLLSAFAPPSAIIAEPNAHSRYLGEDEFTVDPKMLTDIVVLKRYLAR